MKKIDLHGYTENEAILKIDSFLWEFIENDDYECEIITGNGIVIKNLVIDAIKKENLNYKIYPYNLGSIIVKK